MEAIQIFKTNKETSMAVMRKYLRSADDDILAEAYDYFSAKIQKTPYPSADETVSESAFRKQWKNRCFAHAQHDIPVICSIAIQSRCREDSSRYDVGAVSAGKDGRS